MAPSEAEVLPGTDHSAPSPRPTRGRRAAAASPPILSPSPPRATKQSLAKPLGKALPNCPPLKENVPPVTAPTAPVTRSAPLQAASQATPSRKTSTRSGQAVVQTPDRPPDKQTPPSSQLGERQSSRTKRLTPRARDWWAQNKNKQRREGALAAAAATATAAPAPIVANSRFQAALRANRTTGNDKSSANSSTTPAEKRTIHPESDYEDNHNENTLRKTRSKRDRGVSLLNAALLPAEKASHDQDKPVSHKQPARTKSHFAVEDDSASRQISGATSPTDNHQSKHSKKTFDSSNHSAETQPKRKTDPLYYNGFQPDNEIDEEAEEKAFEERQQARISKKKQALSPKMSLDDYEMSEEEGYLQMKDKSQVNRSGFLSEPEDTMNGNEESDALLHGRYSPLNPPTKRKNNSMATGGEENEDGTTAPNLSPSKRPKKTIRTKGGKKSDLEALLSPSALLNRLGLIESSDEDDEFVPKNGESHTAMMARLQRSRAAKGKGVTRTASIANLRNAKNSSKRSDALPFGGKNVMVLKPVDDYYYTDDTEAAPPSTRPRPTSELSSPMLPPPPPPSHSPFPPPHSPFPRPSSSSPSPPPPAPSPSPPSLRRSRRSRNAAESEAQEGAARMHSMSTRNSSEPMIQRAKLDEHGTNLEFDPCPYHIPEENQGTQTHPVAYDRKHKDWDELKPCRIRVPDVQGRATLLNGFDTIEVDLAKTKLASIDDLVRASSGDPDPLPQHQHHTRNAAGLAREPEIQLARVMECREGGDGFSYMMVAWYWDRKDVEKQLCGYAKYLNRRWPKEMGWEVMLSACFDVVRSDAVVRVVAVDINPKVCKEMLYGGPKHNFEIFGRDVGLEGYNLNGALLAKEDRDIWKKWEKQHKKSKATNEELDQKRTEVEVELRALYKFLWPPAEDILRMRAEAIMVDREMGLVDEGHVMRWQEGVHGASGDESAGDEPAGVHTPDSASDDAADDNDNDHDKDDDAEKSEANSTLAQADEMGHGDEMDESDAN